MYDRQIIKIPDNSYAKYEYIHRARFSKHVLKWWKLYETDFDFIIFEKNPIDYLLNYTVEGFMILTDLSGSEN